MGVRNVLFSVTRWLDSSYNTWPFTTMDFSQWLKNVAKVGQQFCQILKNCQCLIKFSQIWSQMDRKWTSIWVHGGKHCKDETGNVNFQHQWFARDVTKEGRTMKNGKIKQNFYESILFNISQLFFHSALLQRFKLTSTSTKICRYICIDWD